MRGADVVGYYAAGNPRNQWTTDRKRAFPFELHREAVAVLEILQTESPWMASRMEIREA